MLWRCLDTISSGWWTCDHHMLLFSVRLCTFSIPFPSLYDQTLPSSAALCLRFRLFVPLSLSLVSRTSSRSRGQKKNPTKKQPHKCNCGYFCKSFIYSSHCFEFLIYYNSAIYMKKAVGSVECYLLPSCVFVKWGNIWRKKNIIFLFFWSEFCEQ